MSDTLILDGKEYVSSKRAAEASGYAQDYIGQLARAGFIDAKRVGGLWYISLDSLREYKQSSENRERPTSRQNQGGNPVESIVRFDGTEYIAAAKAAEITGYNPDYVSQLARAGTVPSRQVGNRWYVDRDKLLAHKNEKDSLLAAVQARSVGIASTTLNHREGRADRAAVASTLRYIEDDRELIPEVRKVSVVSGHTKGTTNNFDEKLSPVVLDLRGVTIKSSTQRREPLPSRIRFGRPAFQMSALKTAAVILAAFLFTGIGWSVASTFVSKRDGGIEVRSRDGSFSTLIEKLGGELERLLSKELRYIRLR